MHCRAIDVIDAGEVEEKMEKRIEVGDDKTKKGNQISGGDCDRVAHNDVGQKDKKR
jgi:ABC-type lipoprotein export system ATPase subunit